MRTTLAEGGSDPWASTTPMLTVHSTLQLSARTVAWLAEHPRARRLVRSVWDTLTELQRAGHHPATLDALRLVLTQHQPSSAGRCRTCRRWAWRRPPFPCVVWHQVRGELLNQSRDYGEGAPRRRLGRRQ
jgi:hypothetical protein